MEKIEMTQENIAKIYKVLNEDMIYTIEIESEFGGRHWETGTRLETNQRLDNLDEDEYLSDYDFCYNQPNPFCSLFIDKMHEPTTNPHHALGIKEYLPHFLCEINMLNMEDIREMDKPYLEKLKKNLPSGYVEMENPKYYVFETTIGSTKISVRIPFLLFLNEIEDEGVAIFVNYNIDGINGAITNYVKIEQLFETLEKLKGKEFQKEFVKVA